ncbi:hypothetical protein KDW_35300 [Dictyobacter vulcani]|uniref:Uncharacterized protein n=1 Tax=Dictyobacter vulcani TaxID=2607529 RepID=A0A5J4KHW1_9CHLR|nr:hypothetical protein KDW_35300 [Dictyobacter vulcani]
MNAYQHPSGRMPFSMPAQSMCACDATAASAIALINKTDVITSVSLFVLVHILIPGSLLLELVVTIILSLLIIGLIGLARHESLVGQNSKVATRNTWGD